MTTLSSQTPQMQRELKVAAKAMAIGTFLEWYDFTIYGIAAALVFGQLFFPQGDPIIGMIASFGVYAMGFAARPVGAILFGRIGDRIGRKWVMICTILMMGISTILIGVLPTYQHVGIWAPIILVVLRLMQGFSAGAEQGGATLIMCEFAPPKQRGFFASLPFIGSQAGMLLASGVFLLVTLLPEEAIQSWGWRLPFLSSIVVVLLGVFLRRHLPETPTFTKAAAEGKLSKKPLSELLEKGRASIIRGIALKIGENGTSYLYFTFSLTFLNLVVGVSKSIGTIAISLSAAAGIFSVVMAGALSDRFGRRPVYIAGAIFQLLFIVPAFLMLESGNPVLICLALVIAIAVGVNLMLGSQAAFLPELFSARYRYTGVGLSREIGAVLSGGLAPLVAVTLLKYFDMQWWPVAVYAAILTLISLLGALYSPETAGRDLTHEEDARFAREMEQHHHQKQSAQDTLNSGGE